jgi:hypothetical protein
LNLYIRDKQGYVELKTECLSRAVKKISKMLEAMLIILSRMSDE